MIQLVNLHMEFGGRVLFEDVSWKISPKDRIALIGANGTGKSTLLKIICGEMTPTSGHVVFPRHWRIGYLPQHGLHARGKPLMDEVLTAFAEVVTLHEQIRSVERQLAELSHESPQYEKRLDEYGALQHRFEDLGGFAVEAKAARILSGLGFAQEDYQKPCEAFSGGWQMRIALAKLLLQQPDTLLLDEPTNHLDVESIEWLELYLKDYDGSVLMVSHDRYFIDTVCNRITELDRRAFTHYVGSYDAYEEQKAQAEEQLLNSYERQQDELKRIQVFIDRFRYKATKARQVQSRVKMLERMDKIVLPDEERKAVHFRFPQPVKSGRIVLEIEDVHRSFGDRHVLRGVNLTLERGDRVALVGPNGAGKSTLLKILTGGLSCDRGAVQTGHNVTMEYFAQQQADHLNPDHSVYEEVFLESSGQPPLVLRTILGAFLFSGDDINKKVRVLSGGERARLAFAKMLLNPANFIILDEPTNHIDAQTKDILLGALMDYEGTLLVVSHDRHFVDMLVNKVAELRQGSILWHIGTYQEYLEKRKQREQTVALTPVDTSAKSAQKEQWLNQKEKQKQHLAKKRKGEKERADLEKQIEAAEKRKEALAMMLADPDIYKQSEKAIRIQDEYRDVEKEIESLYRKWEAMV